MNFPKLTGTIKPVDSHHYDDLVEMYVDCVSRIDGVLGIVLFGSVSTPGLSDIDIVVTVRDNGPFPDWNSISLKRLAKNHPAESIVAHDIFVWPERVARNAESFFYVDQQTVLMGNRLGGELTPSQMQSFQQLLSMDYLIHRFDSLSHLLSLPQISLRSALLFISTLRHTCVLAAKLNLMTQAESDATISDINALRSEAINNKNAEALLAGWPERIVRLLWSTTIEMGKQMQLNHSKENPKNWQPSSKLVFVGSNSNDGVPSWKLAFTPELKGWSSKYVRAAPIPAIAYHHVLKYFDVDSPSGNFLANAYPRIFKDRLKETPSAARVTRVESVVQHWNLTNRSGFVASSGKGYLGVAMPAKPGLKDTLLRQLARFHAQRLRSQ